MTTETGTHILEIKAHDANSLQDHLNAALLMAQGKAISECRHGILVTQHGYTSYTVAITPDVPYGETRERRQWTHKS